MHSGPRARSTPVPRGPRDSTATQHRPTDIGLIWVFPSSPILLQKIAGKQILENDLKSQQNSKHTGAPDEQFPSCGPESRLRPG
jgi:hypothetical protein